MKTIIALAASLLITSGLATAEPMTLEDVSVLRQVTTVRMSPTGDRIAYLLQVPREIYVDADGSAFHELHVTDLEGNSIPYVTGDVDITDIAWAADGESIFFLAQRDEEAEFNSLYQIELAGGEAQQLFTHVSSNFGVSWGQAGGNALWSVQFRFTGETAHSAGSPWRGRSALDAVMLMAQAWEFKREHLRPAARSHYIIVDGGDQPNVVPQTATIWFYFRERNYELTKEQYDAAVLMADAQPLVGRQPQVLARDPGHGRVDLGD